MLIRSQDKKNLCTLTHVSIIKKDKTNKFREVTSIEYGIVNWIGNNYIVIGVYSTEEKAIKVLDMISQNYAESEKYIIRRSFQMPQDSEV